MQKSIIALILTVVSIAFGAYLKNIPVSINQPDGSEISCFATGDEFFNRLHDASDFTIIQGDDGWFYYGIRSGDEVVPSGLKVGETDPEISGLKKGAKISEKLYREKVDSFNEYIKIKGKDAPTTGTINNLVIFIRFSDETETIFNSKRSYYDNYFNKTDGSSLGNYFNEVSYEKLEVSSTYYPHVDDFATNLSYQDINPRAYFQPYNATTNPIGYVSYSERVVREHDLLERAVIAVADEVPAKLDIDSNNDGYVDNVVFLISGAPGAWASLLWPHRWILYSNNVLINGKRVYDYNFDLTGTTTYFTVGVICHEFFHTLGAPDLYHYYDDISPDAVGAWDVMNDTSNPPQYMGAWMKYKYGDWIDSVPIISEPGEYILNPLTSPTGNIYRINSPNSTSEFFVLEYRKQTGFYEPSLPGNDDGILIYRINSHYEGNAGGPPDEVYVFRPNGTTTVWGSLNDALFSKALGRTEFNFASNPYPFLSDGSVGGINISNIGYAGETISFSIALNVLSPKNIVGALGYGSIELNWTAPDIVDGVTVSHYRLYRNSELLADNLTETKFIDMTVEESISYKYSVSAYYTGTTIGESSFTQTDDIIYKAPYSAPYSTDFSTQTDWSQVSINCTPRWKSSNSSFAGGNAPEMMAEMEYIDPATSMYLSPAVSTTGIDTLLVSFKHFYDGFDSGVTYKLQISSNKFDWTDTGWSFAGTASDAGPELAQIELTEFPDPVYVSWTLDGNLWNYDGWYIDDISIKQKNPSSIEDGTVPSSTKLYGNYPNPFNPETMISFDLYENTEVRLDIFDMKGSLVRTLLSKDLPAGNHKVSWDGKDNSGNSLSSGVYYINLMTGKENFTHKSLMIK
ncbi:MAG: M6 family metalloprotease domain-containing protein [Candidatus Delongbacteria bacterium]|nr:M6 family metalloprotease domain-containing protein [Candidatus Delongbacteria bacterium]MCG2761266.1 M6 family metalloprotease domain-containing protein [Candidatus Delongbacteria bacterium]